MRHRFGLRDDDLAQLTSWVRATGVRWAFDAEHRADYGLESVVSHTWEFGLDRLLAGVAMSDDTGAWLGRTLPLDDVGSGQVDLAGRVVELVRRLREATDRLVGAHPLEHWLATLGDAVAGLTSVPTSESWQSGQVQRELSRIREDAAGRGDLELRLPDVRAMLDDRLAGRPTRANFRTGTLTVCTMVPMRSVPHRVICLVGLDDGVFPRVGAVDGDDVLARDPLTGERDPRSEDRQLFLDAVLAATDTLVITCTGSNEYSGQQRPPAVPVKELLDALDVTATPPGDASSVAGAVRVEHPLQPFDERNFEAGRLGVPTAFSHDRTALAAARVARGERVPTPPLLVTPLEPRPPQDVQLEDLVAFFCRRGGPVAGFLSAQRLDVTMPREEDPLEDGLPVELDQLQRWQVGDRLLALAASDEERSWTAHTLGRPASSRSRDAVGTSLLGPLDHTARDLLGDLVAMRDRGLCEPLPLPLKASFAYAKLRRTQGTVDEALRKAGWDWDDGKYPGECSDPAHVAAWGAGAGLPGLDVLLTREQGSW